MSDDRANFLDVEDDEKREQRIGTLLEQLNTSSPSTVVPPKPVLNIGRERAPGPVELPTELLSRVQAFLPAISASNQALTRMEPKDIDIENIQGEEQYIEMNLGLGVFEGKPHPNPGSPPLSPSPSTPSEAESTSSDSESDSELDSGSPRASSESASSSSSDEGSDAESQSGSSVDMKPIFSRIIRPLPRRVSGKTKTEGEMNRN